MIIKPVKILNASPYSITCLFSSGESKRLEVKSLLDELLDKKVLSKDILDEYHFSKVEIGDSGELVWNNYARMKNENNEWIPCPFDISPEYVYANSKEI